MADGSPRVPYEARTGDWLDPRNPLSRGYDVEAPEFKAVRDEAHGDPLVARCFGDVLRAETTRWRGWVAEYERRGSGGVRRAGDPMDRFIPTHPAVLLDRARETVRRRVAWQQSPQGQLHKRIHDALNAAEAYTRAASELVDAVDRGDGSAMGRAEALERAATDAHTAAVLCRQGVVLADRVAPHVADLRATIHDICMSQAGQG